MSRDVGRIDTIPSQSLESIKVSRLHRTRLSYQPSGLPALNMRLCLFPQDWLTSIEIKYYESKVNLNWKNIVKSIKEARLDKQLTSSR